MARPKPCGVEIVKDSSGGFLFLSDAGKVVARASGGDSLAELFAILLDNSRKRLEEIHQWPTEERIRAAFERNWINAPMTNAAGEYVSFAIKESYRKFRRGYVAGWKDGLR